MQHPLKTIGLTKKATMADLRCLLLVKCGLSLGLISEKTRLTRGQIAYRCKCAGIKVTDYRDGTSDFSKQVIGVAEKMSASYYDDLRIEIRKVQVALGLPEKSLSTNPWGQHDATHSEYERRNAQRLERRAA